MVIHTEPPGPCRSPVNPAEMKKESLLMAKLLLTIKQLSARHNRVLHRYIPWMVWHPTIKHKKTKSSQSHADRPTQHICRGTADEFLVDHLDE